MVKPKFWFKKIPLFFLSIFLSLNLIIPLPVLAQIQDVVDSAKESNVFLYVGDLVTVKVKSLTKIAVANPGIVDITNATADEMILVGRKVGETQIFLWGENGKKEILAHVVSNDINRLAERIASLIQSAKIQGVFLAPNYSEGKVILSGSLNKKDKKKLEEVIKNFGDSVLNLVIEEGDLIQIDVQFSELDTTLSKALGFDWTAGGSALAFTFQETLPAQSGNFADLFKIGDFARTSAIMSVVNLIIEEGKGRILSKPSLVVTNGEQASFMVGGEIPIRTTTTISGTSSIQDNVTYKDYGVDLQVTPEIRDGKIDIEVKVTVRNIDGTLKSANGDVAFLTRTATTKVRLADSQTIVLAGMIQRHHEQSIKRVPFLSKIPAVGILFKKVEESPNTEQELVVSLTPSILKNLPVKKLQNNLDQQQSFNKSLTPEASKVSRVSDSSKSESQIQKGKEDAKKKAKDEVLAQEKLKKQKEEQAKKDQESKIAAQIKEKNEKAQQIKREEEAKKAAEEKLKKQKEEQAKKDQEAKIAAQIKEKNEKAQQIKREEEAKKAAEEKIKKQKEEQAKKDQEAKIAAQENLKKEKEKKAFEAKQAREAQVKREKIIKARLEQEAKKAQAQKAAQEKAQREARKKNAKALWQNNASKPDQQKSDGNKGVFQTNRKVDQKKNLDNKETQLKTDNQKSSEVPSLNMLSDEPRMIDPQNVLSRKEISALEEKYSNRIKAQMLETISYPLEAKESHWEGTVALNITILPDGSVKNVSVVKSSGYPVFDKDAVSTAEILSPYDRFLPAKNLRELVVPVLVEYSEKTILRTLNPEKK